MDSESLELVQRRSAEMNAADNVPKIPAELPNFIVVSKMTKRKISGTIAFSELFSKIITKAHAVTAHRALWKLRLARVWVAGSARSVPR
jgi:hypothetical protein